MDPEHRYETNGQATPLRLRRAQYLAQLARFRRSKALYQRAEAQYHELVHSLPRVELSRSSESPSTAPSTAAAARDSTPDAPQHIVLGPADRAVPKSQRLSASQSTESDAGPLTARQREVAGLLAAGYTNKQIAEILVLTPGTVANHVAHILDRLDLRNRSQIGVWAVRHGLFDPNVDAVAEPEAPRRLHGVTAARPIVPRP